MGLCDRYRLMFRFSSVLVLLLACSPNEEHSAPHTIFGDHKLRIISADEHEQALMKSIGALFVGAINSETQTRHYLKYCSGVQIGPRHVLSNAHCAKKIAQDKDADFYFTNELYALNQMHSEIVVDSIADQVYLRFKGQTKVPLELSSQVEPNLSLRFVSQSLDFAIFEFSPETGNATDYVSLDDASPVQIEHSVQLLSLPNGLPLTLSYNCQLAPSPLPLQLKHNCASAGGSSGGLLFAADTHKPLALHRQGISNNSAAFYREHGRSETEEELTARDCHDIYQLKPGSEEYKSCITQRRERIVFNRAIGWYEIRDALECEAPDLARKLLRHPQSCPKGDGVHE